MLKLWPLNVAPVFLELSVQSLTKFNRLAEETLGGKKKTNKLYFLSFLF